MWGDYYPEDDRRAPYFYVTCTQCGTERRNDDGMSCQCGSTGESYSNSDAKRWNRFVDRGRW